MPGTRLSDGKAGDGPFTDCVGLDSERSEKLTAQVRQRHSFGNVGPYVEGYKVADPVRRKSRAVLWASVVVFLLGVIVGGTYTYAAHFSPWVTADAILSSVDIPSSISGGTAGEGDSSFGSGIGVIGSFVWQALPIGIMAGGVLLALFHYSPMPLIGALFLSIVFGTIGHVMKGKDATAKTQAVLSLEIQDLRLKSTRDLLDYSLLRVPSSDKNYVLAQMMLLKTRGRPQNGTVDQELKERIQQVGLDVAQSKLARSAKPVLYKMEREVFEAARSPAAQAYEGEMQAKQKTLAVVRDVTLVLGPLTMAVAVGLLLLSSSMRRRARRIEDIFRAVRSRISGAR